MIRSGVGGLLCLALSAGCALAAGYDDFAQGLNAVNRGDATGAIADFTSALSAGDLAPGLVPLAYFQRARMRLYKGDCADAKADLDQSVSRKADYSDAYVVRAEADVCLKDRAAAIADETSAIAIKPTAEAYFGRARAHWDGGEFTAAAADFAATSALAPRNATVVLWFSLARLRAGTFDAAQLADNVDRLDLDGWPEPLFDYFLGKSSLDDLMKATADDDAAVAARKRCGADFYAAEWQIGHGAAAAAEPLLAEAKAHCGENSIEHAEALLELERKS